MIGRSDGDHRHDFGCRIIGQMCLADLFADGDDDALPAQRQNPRVGE